jgi:hypothetical protein
MKDISISRLKKMLAEEIRESGCFELTADSQHVAYVIVGTEGEMKTRIEAIASQIDAGRGK